jgi:hypothetical protein
MQALQEDNPLKEQLSLKGKINFITQVSPTVGAELATEFDKIVW